MMSQSFLYTIISEYEGSTLVEQMYAANLEDMFERWVKETKAPVSLSKIKERYYQMPLLEGLKNAWCTSFSDEKGTFFLLNVIATKSD